MGEKLSKLNFHNEYTELQSRFEYLFLFRNEKTIHEYNAVKHRQSGQRLNRQSVKLRKTNRQDLQWLNINLQPRKEYREDDKEGAALQVQRGKLEDKTGAFLVDPPPKPQPPAPQFLMLRLVYLPPFLRGSVCSLSVCSQIVMSDLRVGKFIWMLNQKAPT